MYACEDDNHDEREQSPPPHLEEILLFIMAILERSLDCTEFLGPKR